jgi:hypothetical protein
MKILPRVAPSRVFAQGCLSFSSFASSYFPFYSECRFPSEELLYNLIA